MLLVKTLKHLPIHAPKQVSVSATWPEDQVFPRWCQLLSFLHVLVQNEGMDFKSFIAFIVNHYILIVGSGLASIFFICTVLLIRSIGKRDDGESVNAVIDVKEIEGAMKRVLASQPVSVVAAADGASSSQPAPVVFSGEGGDSEAIASLQKAVTDRDAHIEQLNAELAKAKEGGGGGGDAGASSAMAEENQGLKTKLEELQGRLAEYEIIEDDIADLSMFKDENARLKDEMSKLKEELARAKTQPAPAAPAPATAAAAPVAAEPSPALKFEKSEKFELDPNDDIMKEFAAIVDGQVSSAPPPPVAPPSSDAPVTPAPNPLIAAEDPQAAIDALLQSPATPEPIQDPQAAIDALLMGDSQPAPELAAAPAVDDSQAAIEELLNGAPDTEKMLSEAQSLAESDQSATDALEDSLDTDKLLAEVDSLGPKQTA